MSDTSTLRDRLITEFAESYMEKLFYFCLKKTGNQTEAEDLTQEIALHILTALNKDTVPMSFSAWVWQIARNRYAVWATEKHRRNESLTGDDIDDYEIQDESEHISEDMIHREQLALLRRELAFIRSDYRTIVVAYYIENRTMGDIASTLSLSLDTVKKRLQRARIILKEGMDMAREFGVRSYRPEEIVYHNNCVRPGAHNQPYSLMGHKLYQNILLEAYGNPSTAEALSLELGVALPYMEDELEYLTRETLLVKNNGKYQTALPIISRGAQEQARSAHLAAAPEITKALIDFTERLNEAFVAQGYPYYGQYQDYESAKWSLLMLAYDHFMHKTRRIKTSFTERPDGGIWDMIATQSSDAREPYFVGNHSGGNGFQQFKYEFDGINEQTPDYLVEEESKVLYDAITGEISAEDMATAEILAAYGYLRKDGDVYKPACLALNLGEIKNRVKAMDESTVGELTALSEIAKTRLKALHHQIEKIIIEDLPPIFREDAHQCRLAVINSYFARGYVMAEALKCGYLLPADRVSPVIGAHLWIE